MSHEFLSTMLKVCFTLLWLLPLLGAIWSGSKGALKGFGIAVICWLVFVVSFLAFRIYSL